MSDPFNVQQGDRRPQPRFGRLEVEFEAKKNKQGGEYYQYTINIYPVSDGQNPSKTEYSFWKGWLHIFQPSLHEMVKQGKAASASELATGNKWVKYQWSEHRSYDNADIRQNKENYPEGNKKDEDGMIYASIRSIQILDVFADEDACLAANDKHYKIDAIDSEVPDGFGEKEPAVEAVDTQTAMAFFDGLRNTGLKPIFRKAFSEKPGNGLDLDLVKEKLAKQLPMMANLDFEDARVLALIEEVENEPPF